MSTVRVVCSLIFSQMCTIDWLDHFIMVTKIVILMADYGNDPTEVAVPFTIWKDAGAEVTIATQNGTVPACDKRMYEGWTQKLLV